MIRMSENAAERWKSVLTSKSLPEETPLRVDVEANEQGEAALTLMLDEAAPREGDHVEETNGARLVVRGDLSEQLGQGELDFRENRFVLVKASITQ